MAKKAKKENVEGYVAKASLSSVRVSPQKARLVVNLIRGTAVATALDQLEFCDKKMGPVIKKLLLSAVANAKERASVDVDELMIKKAWVDGGPILKRSMPRAQGRATPIRKRTSSITLILDEIN